MTIQDYIASGIIEDYVMRTTNPQEDALVENLLIHYPWFKKEIELYQKSLGVYVLKYATNPPKNLKLRVLNRVLDLDKE